MEKKNQSTKREPLLRYGGRLSLKQFYLIMLCFFALNSVQGQNFNRQTSINLQIEADTTLNPFDGSNVTSIGVSGQVTFTSDLGFVRFVVSDGNDDDYMVYETYRVFEEDSIIFFSQKCEESCFYETYVPTDFIIQVKDAIINLNTIDFSSAQYTNAEYQRLAAATSADNVRLAKIQDFIQSRELIWVADHTKLSNLSYNLRAKLWGKDYKSYGFEYYAGGIYCLEPPDRNLATSNDFVADFDWRNRHGANTPTSPYYDGDVYGTGWLSPITCQLGCWEDGVLSCVQQNDCTGEWRSAGTCWSFGTTAQVEALANLYFNNHLDLDLSEQYPACQEYTPDPYNNSFLRWEPHKALDHYQNEGVPYEYCWPYTASPDDCTSSCPEPMERVSINSYTIHQNINDANLRQLIMEKGTLAAGSIPSQTWISHCMLLAGWGTVDETSPRVTGLPPGTEIPESWYGITYWIYKNSYGISNLHNMFEGYSYVIHNYHDGHPLLTPSSVYEVPVPINVPGLSESNILCEDKDGDGYYNWGIGPKPAHCPPCPDEPDSDDNNPSLGPLNEQGQRTIINTYTSSFENGWDDWLQVTYTEHGQDDLDWWRHKGPTGHFSHGGYPTGPGQAQDGEYYIYVNGSLPCDNNDMAVIQSPPFDFSGIGACVYYIDFYYHMKSYNYGNDEKNKLYIVFLKKGQNEERKLVAMNNQGNEWQHCRKEIPKNTYQIQFISSKGNDFCDIALDNITIGPWNHDETPIVITEQTVWENSTEINQDIIVENGGKLTIKKSGSSQVKIKMHPESKIVVKPGGQLILDGCKLVSGCSAELWQGIQVWGDKTKDQKKHGDTYYQGYLEMKNQASIEDAICAVELWNPGHWSTTGGIIIANNATFKNNAKAIHALHYQYIQNGQIADYKAKFTECTFTINAAYKNTVQFYKHVDLAQVQGVRFNGCTFVVDENVQNISDWTIGIAAYNAGFIVDATYLYQTNGVSIKKRPLFSGFQRAIQSVETLETNTPKFTVKHADFRDNDYGIFARKSNYATIVDCDFEVGLNAWYSCNAGIHLDNISSFAIEENRFSKGNKAVNDNFGIILKDSKSQNEIYYNDFDGLYCANLAVGVNNTGIRENYFGTEYLCNENENNDIDFYVLSNGNNNEISGIQSQQGQDVSPTRNTFSQDAYHFYNGGTHRVTYAYYDNPSASDEVPLRYNEDKFIPNPSSQLWECVSHYGNGGGSNNGSETPVLTSAQKQQIEQDYYDAYYPYALVKSAYDRLIDGGNTSATLAEIEAATPADMWRLRSQLLGASPFVSQDVLFAAGERDDVFTESVLFEILLSNPDELKKDTLMHYLENKVPPMPGYMLSILNQVANGSSARTAMESQMSSYRRAFSRAAGDMVRSILNDTVVNMAELRGWLGNMNDLNADRDIIATYMAEGDFNNAFYLANMLPGLYGLEGAALQEHSDYMALLNLYRNLQTDNRSTLQLNDTELAVVEDMADNGTGVAKAMAQSILEGAYGYHFEDCPVVPYPEGGTRSMAGNLISPEDMGKALGFTVSLKPNPATTWIAIDYTLPMDYRAATVEIANTLGVKVLQKQLNGHEGQSVVDLRGLANGVYTLTVMCGEYVLTEKLVISR